MVLLVSISCIDLLSVPGRGTGARQVSVVGLGGVLDDRCRGGPTPEERLPAGMQGDGRVVQALLASITEKDDDEEAVRREVYDSCNSVPDAIGAVLLQVAAADPGSVVPFDQWRIESLYSSADGGGKSAAENCTCVPILEFVNSANRCGGRILPCRRPRLPDAAGVMGTPSLPPGCQHPPCLQCCVPTVPGAHDSPELRCCSSSPVPARRWEERAGE